MTQHETQRNATPYNLNALETAMQMVKDRRKFNIGIPSDGERSKERNEHPWIQWGEEAGVAGCRYLLDVLPQEVIIWELQAINGNHCPNFNEWLSNCHS